MLKAVFNGLKWITARKWGRWLLIILVTGIAYYSWNLYTYEPYRFYELVRQIKVGLLVIAGIGTSVLAIVASFTPSVPADKIGVRIVKFPILDQLQAGEVVTTTLWVQGTYANPIPPGTSKFFPLIRVWMWIGWIEIEHRDLTDIDPRAVDALISNVGEKPADEDILYWGNGVGEYSGVILKADVPESAKVRGILSAVLQPGKHSINVDTGDKLGAFKKIVVDTSPNTVHLDDHPVPKDRNHHKFGSIVLKTADGYLARIELEVVLEIQNHVRITNHRDETFELPGPVLIVARNGSFEDAIRDVVVPITQSCVNATVADTSIDEFIDKMKEVQERLLVSLQEAIDAKYPQGDSAIHIMNVSLIFNPKGFPDTEEYIKTRTTKAMQPALLAMKEAEIPVAEKDRELQEARARAKYAEVPILAELQKIAATNKAEASKIELEAIAGVISQKGLSGLGQLALVAHNVLRDRIINEGEEGRDTADIAREGARLERDKVIRSDAPTGRRKRRDRDRARSGESDTATLEEDENEGEVE